MSAVAEHAKSPARAAFRWEDPLLLEEQLDEDELMIQAASRSFADAELRPRVRADFLDEDSDPGLFRLMGKTGLLGFFMGQVMRETGGKANPQLTRGILEAKLRDIV